MIFNAPLYELIYVSSLAPDTPVSAVADITAKARVSNANTNITGLLVFDGQRFCQQLEGTQKEVLRLAERIAGDDRHTHMEVVHHGVIEQRRFKSFALAFCSEDGAGGQVDTLARLEKLDGQAAVQAFDQLLSTLDLEG